MATKCDRQSIAKDLMRFIRIERNYRNINLCRDDVAEILGVTKGMLTSVIHNELQTTFADLVNRYRANHAYKLLMSAEEDSVTLEEIAIMSGFSNRMTMHRAFLKVYGKSPGKVREELSVNF